MGLATPEIEDFLTSAARSKSSLDSLEGIRNRSSFDQPWDAAINELSRVFLGATLSTFSHEKTKRRKKSMEPEQRKHRDRVRGNTSSVRPSREGLVPLMAHVPEELRSAMKERAEQSGVTLNEFLTAIFRKVIQDPAQEQSSASVAEVLKQTSELQKKLSNLALDLSSRSPSR